MAILDSHLNQMKPMGFLLLRAIFGIHFMLSSYPEVFSSSAQREFAGFLSSIHVPFPLVSAYLCHYTEFFGGLVLVLGLALRYTTIPLIINFSVAVFVAQWGKPYKDQFQAIQALIVCLFFFINGAGSLSIDRLFQSSQSETRNPNPAA
jgi:putative oxidoreductase